MTSNKSVDDSASMVASDSDLDVTGNRCNGSALISTSAGFPVHYSARSAQQGG